MKRIFIILLSGIMVLALVGCNGQTVQYEINFDSNGGTVVEPITTDGSSVLIMPENPTKEGYEFNGWYSDNEIFEVPFIANSLLGAPLSSDMTVYAKWSYIIIQYSVEFADYDGTVLQTSSYDFGADLSGVTAPTDPSREGYTFDGWDITVPLTMGTAKVTVTAMYTVNQYTVEYVDYDGTVLKTSSYDFGAGLSGVTAPTDPSREGYTFDGWDITVPLTMGTAKVTVTATYTVNQENEPEFTVIELDYYETGSLLEEETGIYKLTITEAVTVDIYSESSYDMYGEIYTSLDELIISNDDSGNDRNFLIDDLYLEPGVYYIHIVEFFGFPVTYYELHVDTAGGSSPGTEDEVFTIDLNSSASGTLSSGRVHSYTISVPSDGDITVYLESAFDSVGYIKNSIGDIIVANDDSTFDDDFKIESFTLTAGTYSIFIEGYSSYEYGDYTLYVIFEESVEESNTGELIYNITASDAEDNDHFGENIAVDGNYIVIGATDESTSGTGAGAVYLYKVDDPSYERKITASDAISYDFFGSSVAIYGNYIVVGSINSGNGSIGMVGAVYIYKVDDPSYERKITASEGSSYDLFGSSVAIYGNYIVVGAENDDANGSYSGSVYIYKLDDNLYERKILSSDIAYGDQFGCSVDIFGNYVVVGAKYTDANGTDSGSVYIYKLDDNSYERKITASDAFSNDRFGNAVNIDGNYIVVSAAYSDGKEENTGSVYVYKIDDNLYERKIYASDGVSGTRFGYSISLAGDSLIVGDYFSSIGTMEKQGSAYLYLLNDESYELKIYETDGNSLDYYGYGVAISNDYIVIGVRNDNEEQGSVYLYTN